MKAAVLTAKNRLEYTDIPAPEVTEAHTLVRVKACGICGSDIPRVLSGAVHFYPVVLGHEFSGEVVKTCGNSRFDVGDRVTGVPLLPCMSCGDCQSGNYSLCKNYSFIGSRQPGAFAEYVLMPEANLVRFGDGVSFETGAFFEPSTVALHGIFVGGFKPGRTAAVLGCGTIGLFTVQWLKLLGASQITAFDILDEKLELAKSLGADSIVNSLTNDADERIKAQAPKGFDYVFETAGSAATMKKSFELAGNKANVCFIGTPTKEICFTAKEFELLNRKEFTLTGSWMSYSAPFPGREWELTAKYFSDGKLKAPGNLIFKRYPLSRTAEAFALFENPSQVKGKILITEDDTNA